MKKQSKAAEEWRDLPGKFSRWLESVQRRGEERRERKARRNRIKRYEKKFADNPDAVLAVEMLHCDVNEAYARKAWRRIFWINYITAVSERPVTLEAEGDWVDETWEDHKAIIRELADKRRREKEGEKA